LTAAPFLNNSQHTSNAEQDSNRDKNKNSGVLDRQTTLEKTVAVMKTQSAVQERCNSPAVSGRVVAAAAQALPPVVDARIPGPARVGRIGLLRLRPAFG